ncbi:MAG: hypothetical protein D4R84_08860 [Rhodocyclaceae bacterium]|nr:MAG: hypothetical protein D4R84_08860 [Rhodocyclaceae bacterium]
MGYAGGLADCFATPKARKELIGLAADATQPAKYRALALDLIAANCWRPDCCTPMPRHSAGCA